MIFFEEKYFSHYDLLTDQLPSPDHLYFLFLFVLKLFAIESVMSYILTLATAGHSHQNLYRVPFAMILQHIA